MNHHPCRLCSLRSAERKSSPERQGSRLDNETQPERDTAASIGNRLSSSMRARAGDDTFFCPTLAVCHAGHRTQLRGWRFSRHWQWCLVGLLLHLIEKGRENGANQTYTMNVSGPFLWHSFLNRIQPHRQHSTAPTVSMAATDLLVIPSHTGRSGALAVAKYAQTNRLRNPV